ncbi:MAG: hypothetical protein IJT82_00795 [Schwartzia sp.]|nr:hypothetical protein [Schwartzia sp. (in: firmicutes)]
MKKSIFIVLMLLALGGGAVLAIVMRPPSAPKPQLSRSEQMARDSARVREAEARAEREREAKFQSLIEDGKKKFYDGHDANGALDILSDAVSLATNDAQKYEAFSWRAEVLDGLDDARQKSAGEMMRSLAHGDREMAGAYHVIARAEERIGEYRAAVSDYQRASGYYVRAAMDEMAWLDLAQAARVAADGARERAKAEKLWDEAWRVASQSRMTPEKRDAALYQLCLDRADMAANAKKWSDELKWHREAAKYDKSHIKAADALEESLRVQRKI